MVPCEYNPDHWISRCGVKPTVIFSLIFLIDAHDWNVARCHVVVLLFVDLIVDSRQSTTKEIRSFEKMRRPWLFFRCFFYQEISPGLRLYNITTAPFRYIRSSGLASMRP